jgi:flagellin
MSLFSVNTNLGALAALQALDATQQAMTAAQNQVSTGQSVANASDNPAIYSISNTINANIAGLSAVSSSLNFGAQIVSTASNGIANISTTLQSLQQTVTNSGTSGYNLTTLQAAVTNDLAAINEYAAQASFNGVNLLNPATVAGITSNLTVVQGLDGSVYNVANQGLAAATFLGGSVPTSFTQALGISNLNVTNPGYSVTFNNNLSLASFSNVVTGSLLTSPADAAFQITTGTGATAQTFSFEFTDNAANTTPTLQTAQGQYTHVIDVQFNSTTDSTNQIVGDLVNAIRGAGFSVAQNTNGSLAITGQDSSGNAISGVNFGSVSGGGALAAITNSGVTTAANTASTTTALVSTVQSAISAANYISANLGAATQQITGIQNFTTSLSSALTAGVGALTDADLAAESAKLTSLQTKQQLATQSLSIANKQPQSLLTLFQGL